MVDLNVVGQVKIYCNSDLDEKRKKDILDNLSGVVLTHEGQYLWLGTDEFANIERFKNLGNGEFGKHTHIELKKYIKHLDDDQGEVDIEGLDYDNDCLWIIGSHSSKRKKVAVEEDKFLIEGKELKEIERQENRYLLARIPIDANGHVDVNSPKRAWLKRNGYNDLLTDALKKDEYLDLSKILKGKHRGDLPDAEFYFYLPSKENGLDIEGLAVQGNKILIGLRGPVLRGIAILLEIEVEDDDANELTLKAIGDDDREYKRHFLDLDGLGVRELCFEENTGHLLILAGPTMALDGDHALFRLKYPLNLSDNSLSSQDNQQLDYLGDIPHGKKCDRAEGLTFYNDEKTILVVYDSPSTEKERLITNDQGGLLGVAADLFTVPR